MSESVVPASVEQAHPEVPVSAVAPPPDDTAGRRKRKRGFLFWASVGWLVLLCGCAILAPWLPGLPSYTEQVGGLADKPSLSIDGLFGTDGIGRSLLSLVVYGARISLTIAILATILALGLGLALGLLAGYYGGVADGAGTIFANSVAALPPLLLLLALVTAIGASVTGITIALGFLLSEFYLRIVRGAVIATSSREYILAARALGASDRRIMLREILPNILPVLAAVIPMGMAIVIVVEGSLSFLGYGIQPPSPSWGTTIAAGADLLRNYPHVLIGPVATLFLTVFSLNTIGDYLSGGTDVREAKL
jgi:peptide/nickel transport system permease protein